MSKVKQLLDMLHEGTDLRCPNCKDNLGKDAENSKDAYCGNCGTHFFNKYGYTPSKDDYNSEDDYKKAMAKLKKAKHDKDLLSEARKLSGTELDAAAHYMAMSNMGLVPPKFEKKIFDAKSDMKKVYQMIYGEFTRNMESDEMWDDVQPEIKMWKKDLAKGDDYSVGVWDKILATGERK